MNRPKEAEKASQPVKEYLEYLEGIRDRILRNDSLETYLIITDKIKEINLVLKNTPLDAGEENINNQLKLTKMIPSLNQLKNEIRATFSSDEETQVRKLAEDSPVEKYLFGK